MNNETVIVLDFGGQYNQLIARRVRECNVYCEVHPYTLSLEKIKEMNPKGIIFTGGPNSVYDEASPRYERAILELGIPVLGICYGSQLMAYLLDGDVKTAPVSEYGKTEVEVDSSSKLFDGVQKSTICWMSHTDYIAAAPEGFKITATTPVCPVAMENEAEKIIQYNSTLVLHTHRKVQRCYVTSFTAYVNVREIGKWIRLWKNQSKPFCEKVGDGKVLCVIRRGGLFRGSNAFTKQ